MKYENIQVLRVSLNDMHPDRLSIKTTAKFPHFNSKNEEVETNAFSFGFFPLENVIEELCGRTGRKVLRTINSVSADSIGVIDALFADSTISFERIEHDAGDPIPNTANSAFDSKGYHTIITDVNLSSDTDVIADLAYELKAFKAEKRIEKIAGQTNLFDD